MKKLVIAGLALLVLLGTVSCTSARQMSINNQKRGLMMLEGEQVFKNRGFYDSKKSKKHRRKTMKASRKGYRR